ncbi:Z1 domain-containing protein [Gordonibacter sp. Marseille-P4307]|uniref:Z1 domain-containing protein n=1 Tax=Gordonibacter sp. Marseille-P4307 TaxID=2161815 RepID=UPI000F5362C0|nr:Z1 domain-containing protein [Gordonibacter sp. Marseille-P4307]
MDAYEELFNDVSDLVWKEKADVIPTQAEVEESARNCLAFYLDMMKKYPELGEINRDDFVAKVVDQYWKDQSVKQELGHYLIDSDDNTPWLQEINDDVDWHYWNQYESYLRLQRHWSKDVCDAIGKDSFEILALTANPSTSGEFMKKGLVVGNVQSGKTANYLGLICRAADIGYKYIVVMAATTNDLRSQTQQRIEEGFVGYDYRPTIEKSIQRVPVGVGEVARGAFRHPNPGTTRSDDFKKAKMKSLMQVDPENTKEPWVFVIKKNYRTLQNIIAWLEQYRTDSDQLFLVDDEADNASINTQYSKDDISRINSQIRELLSLFNKSVYIGYTATPYANILIDKDQIDEEFGRDLFPRNFIYTLSAADSYFGPGVVFADIEPDDDQTVDRSRYVRFIDDVAKLPIGKKDWDVEELPQSMVDAIRTFVLSAAIKIARNGDDDDVSMLVNISPYNKIQKKYRVRIDEYIQDVLRPPIKNYRALPAQEAQRNSSEIAALKQCWDDEFEGKCEYGWEEIYPTLYSVVRPLRTALINSKSIDSLDYGSGGEHVVAIGGYSLSRGLTLEGLVTSYFARNSRAYDTLMQMGRWFGHRPGYEDVCRVWMTRESAGWCKFVADATDDLVDDLIRMQQQKASPLVFGQKIRSHPSTLMVTARNKMGAGELIRNISLSNKFIETTVLPRNEQVRSTNEAHAFEFIARLESSDCERTVDTKWGPLFTAVPSSEIKAFLKGYVNCDDSMLTKTDKVLEYIEYFDLESKKYWDVLVAGIQPSKHHDSDLHFECCGLQLYRQRRSPGCQTNGEKIFIGNRFKVASKGIQAAGLSPYEKTIAEQEYEYAQSQTTRTLGLEKYYRDHRSRPLLIIHMLDVKFRQGIMSKKGITEYEYCTGPGDSKYGPLDKEFWDREDLSIPAVAWSMSFPALEKDWNVEYVFNSVALQDMSLGEDMPDEDSQVEDEQ